MHSKRLVIFFFNTLLAYACSEQITNTETSETMQSPKKRDSYEAQNQTLYWTHSRHRNKNKFYSQIASKFSPSLRLFVTAEKAKVEHSKGNFVSQVSRQRSGSESATVIREQFQSVISHRPGLFPVYIKHPRSSSKVTATNLSDVKQLNADSQTTNRRLKRDTTDVKRNSTSNNVKNMQANSLILLSKTNASTTELAIKPALENVTVAALVPLSNDMTFKLRLVQFAVDIAIEKVNPMLKSLNKQLVVILRDSQCDAAFSMNAAIEYFIRKELHVMFGPCCDYAAAPVARQVHFWNLPMITPGAFAGDFGNKDVFRLLTRIGSNFNTLLRFFINIMSNNTWRKMNVIYEPFGQTESPVKFCHIVADGLVNGFHLGEEAINASVNFMPKYYKFTLIEEIVDVLPEKIGLDGADLSAAISVEELNSYMRTPGLTGVYVGTILNVLKKNLEERITDYTLVVT